MTGSCLSAVVCVCCCSRSESRQLFQELINEFSFTVDQLLELAGFSCALAIAKVFVLSPLSLLISVSVSVSVYIPSPVAISKRVSQSPLTRSKCGSDAHHIARTSFFCRRRTRKLTYPPLMGSHFAAEFTGCVNVTCTECTHLHQ